MANPIATPIVQSINSTMDYLMKRLALLYGQTPHGYTGDIK
jgi:hypothetical protein